MPTKLCIDGVKFYALVIRGQPGDKCTEMPKTIKCDQCCFRLTPANINMINKLARNIIAYFVIKLLMTTGALV